MATTPQLGYGNRAEASIDTVNQYMRSQPWYQNLIRSFGQDPNSVHLTDNQKQQVIRQAQANGIVVDEGHNGQEVDDSGNFQPKSHTLRNSLIVAGIAGAALLTAGLATPALAGAGGAAGAGAGTGAGAAGAGLGAVEGGAYGLGSGALSALGTGAMGAAGAGAAGAGAGGAFDAAGNFIGDSTFTGGAGGSSGLGSIFSTASKLAGPLADWAGGRAQGAQAEAGVNQAQDRNAVSLFNAEVGANQDKNVFGLNRSTQDLNRATAANNFGLSRGQLANQNAGTDLAQRNFALTAPGARAGNAVRGDILSRAQDVSFSGLPAGINPPTINGGLRPSMFSADTKALGTDMTAQARAAQAKGDTFAPLPDLPTYQGPESGLPTYSEGPKPPTLTGLPSGGLTSALGNTSSLLALAPSFWDAWKQYQQAKG